MVDRTLIDKSMRLLVLFVLLVSMSACSMFGSKQLNEMSNAELFHKVSAARSELPKSPEQKQLRTVHRLPEFPLVINREVNKEIEHFRERDPRYIALAQKRGKEYDRMIKQVLHDEGVPAALSNVAVVESGLKNNVRSPRGAAGLWQFMKRTAQSYGLKVNMVQDQRRDPILATIAASRLLRDLYARYDDWLLALAAYNAGPGHVNKAIESGKTRDFWELSRKKLIYGQTRRYVAKVVAASIIERQPLELGFMNVARVREQNFTYANS